MLTLEIVEVNLLQTIICNFFFFYLHSSSIYLHKHCKLLFCCFLSEQKNTNPQRRVSKHTNSKSLFITGEICCGPTRSETTLARRQALASRALHAPFIRKMLAHYLAGRQTFSSSGRRPSTCNKVCCLMWGISPSF